MLTVTINGLDFKNPVIAASGTFGFGAEYNNLDRKSVRVGKECRSRWSPYH